MIYLTTFLLFNDYGKIKICIKKKCLLGLFSLSLLFFQFYNKISNWITVVLNGVLNHRAKRGGVVAQGFTRLGVSKALKVLRFYLFLKSVTEASSPLRCGDSVMKDDQVSTA